MGEVFRPRRSRRWHYIHQLIEHVETHNCVLGCRHGDLANEYGPSGTCEVMARAALEEPIPEWKDDGEVVMCTAREP